MGNCSLHIDNFDPTISIDSSQFEFHNPIGKGGFSKVWKVTQKKTKQLLALKEMLKSRVIAKRSVHSVMNEKRLLSILKHPFIVNMHHAFQDREYLYLTMDLKTGGDLRYQLTKHAFNEEQAKFLVACLVIGLEYLHSNKILHRDIKPENLVFDGLGYLHITDFGIARIWMEDNSGDTSGTPGYMAPEVMCRQSHSYVADWYAVGVMLYEIIAGVRPYLGKDRKEIRDQILSKQVQLKRNEISSDWSQEALNFTNHLIQRKAQNRLGNGGCEEVKSHPWLIDVEWDKLFRKEIVPTFQPTNSDNFNLKHATEDWNDGIVTKADICQDIFIGYFYNEAPPPAPQNEKEDPNNQKSKRRKNSFFKFIN